MQYVYGLSYIARFFRTVQKSGVRRPLDTSCCRGIDQNSKVSGQLRKNMDCILREFAPAPEYARLMPDRFL